eukprot:gene10266-18960_t
MTQYQLLCGSHFAQSSRHNVVSLSTYEKKVEEELKRLEEVDIIEKVEGATQWVSPLVITPKKNSEEIKICVDMRLPNTSILRTRHPMPTTDELIADLNGACNFSKLDLKQGYHQLTLAEESRNITTFTTHKGLRRYKRLCFGVNSAAEIFQNTISHTIQDVSNTKNMFDDVIIWGKTLEEHNTALEKVLQRFEEKGITLNEGKCRFNKTRLQFYGLVYSKKGTLRRKAIELAHKPGHSGTHKTKMLLHEKNENSCHRNHVKKLSNKHKRVKQNDRDSKAKAKVYYDKRQHTKPSGIKEGDLVLVKQARKNKLTSKFDPKPYRVIDIRGTKVIAERSDHRITRNISFFKKFYNSFESQIDSETDDDDDDTVQTDTEPEADIVRRYPRRPRMMPMYYGQVITH